MADCPLGQDVCKESGDAPGGSEACHGRRPVDILAMRRATVAAPTTPAVAPATPSELLQQLFAVDGEFAPAPEFSGESYAAHATQTHWLALALVLARSVATGQRLPDPTGEVEATFVRLCAPAEVWDETHWLRGEVGCYVTVARRRGSRWYIAGLNGDTHRVHTIRLEDVLPPDTWWRLTIFRDAHKGDATPARQTVVESFAAVASHLRLRLELAGGGGYALVLEPDGTHDV